MTSDKYLLDNADSDLCAIQLLHRWGVPKPVRVEMVERKGLRFIEKIDPLLKLIRGDKKRHIDALKLEVQELIHDYYPKTPSKGGAGKPAKGRNQKL